MQVCDQSQPNDQHVQSAYKSENVADEHFYAYKKSKTCKIQRTRKMFNLLDAKKIMSQKIKSKIELQTSDEVHWMEH